MLELLRAPSGFQEGAFLAHQSRNYRSPKAQPWVSQRHFCHPSGGRKSQGQPRLKAKGWRLPRLGTGVAKHLQRSLTHYSGFPLQTAIHSCGHSVPHNGPLTSQLSHKCTSPLCFLELNSKASTTRSLLKIYISLPWRVIRLRNCASVCASSSPLLMIIGK